MIFEVVGSFIAILLFLFSYKQLKIIRIHETSEYFDGLDDVPVSITYENGADM
ncbi:hypothetical protein [Bacillus gaemokensis]|uniref:ABC transporter permease n=1 Tax=Bacillus gaemokensis TaxID=574375 RepID=A0A073KAR6_9BACI|nr:hypothetical protein [Bacillus gaemokensis]KEK23616.1 ABC transporter permease [Bacillus gaemokensis]KYG26410.1 hypothetical protein AZF08_16600 [Bacillus gaemokensis]